MSKLLDPRICPDCRAALDAEQTCTGCDLRLVGADAVELWQHMVQADRLVEKLRLAPVTLPSPPVPTSPAPTAAHPPLPALAPTAQPPSRPPRRVSALSAQVVLLSIGGLCLLVAAAVFIAVTWSDLGLAGRTSVLSAITLLIGYAAATVTRRGLRGGAETLWLLTAALVSIDVVAARWAGLISDLDPRHVAALLGAILLVGSIAVSIWAATTATVRLSSPIGAAAVGTLVLAVAEAWTIDHAERATAVAVPLLIGTALLISRPYAGRLRPIAGAVGLIGGASWFVLVAQGLDRTGISASQWWHDVRGWPLLVAALWAAAPTLVRQISEPVRYVAATASLLSLVAFALGGTAESNPETVLLCGVALALALVTGFAPHIWARPAAVMTAGAAVAATALTVVRPLGVLDQLPTTGPARGANLSERLAATSWDVATWTAPLIAVVAALCTLGLVRHLTGPGRDVAVKAWAVCAPTLVTLGGVIVVLEARPRLLAAVLVWSGLVTLGAVLAFVGRETPAALACGLVGTGYLVVVDLRLAVASHLLVALVATAAALVLAVAAARSRTDRLDGTVVPLLAGPAVALAAFAATHWPYVAHATGDTAGLALAFLMAVVGVGAARLGRTEAARITIESIALLCALCAPFFAVTDVVVALTVTVTGSAVALVSILNRDRDQLSWLAVVLLGTATALRLADDAVAPELFAVPAACVLVAAGIWRLHQDDQVSSWRALSSGLTLGLLPSLLLTLADPVSVRGAVVAAVAITVLAVGLGRRWGAPFLLGSGAVAALAVRHLGPVAAALPRWISLGSVGVALLLVGISWEARRRDAAAAERYLAALR